MHQSRPEGFRRLDAECDVLNFGAYLELLNAESSDTLLIRNVGRDFGSERHLHWVAQNRPDLLIRYQSYQTQRVEKMMLNKKFLASFVAYGNNRALLLGVFRIGESAKHSYDDFWSDPLNKELHSLGHKGFTKDESKTRPYIRRFDLEPLKTIGLEWSGKLVIGWTNAISWAQHAEPLDKFPILAINEKSLLETPLPAPEYFEVSWNDLRIMPNNWKNGIRQWRGIYLLFDAATGKRYVGSATGHENMLSRWQDYAATGHGGNKHLKGLEPENFRFTVLQLTAPDLPAEDVVRLESSWKNRLHTRHPHGLNEN